MDVWNDQSLDKHKALYIKSTNAYRVSPVSEGWWEFCAPGWPLLSSPIDQDCSLSPALSSNIHRLSLVVGLDRLSRKDLWFVAQHQRQSTAAVLQLSPPGVFRRPSAGTLRCRLRLYMSRLSPFTSILSHQALIRPASVYHANVNPSLGVSDTKHVIKKCCVFYLMPGLVAENSLRNAWKKHTHMRAHTPEKEPVRTHQEERSVKR